MLRAALLMFVLAAPAHADDGADIAADIRADRWPEAAAAAAAYADPVAAKLVRFYRLLAPHAATLAELDAFLADSSDWPAQATLARRREEALAAEPDDAAVRAACATAPTTATALARCADTAADRVQAEGFARAAWIAAAPESSWEQGFLARWAAAIGAPEQRARFDRAAWTDPAAAQHLLPALPALEQSAARARLALRRDDPLAAEYLTAAPPPHDPGLVLEHLRWLRRGGRTAEAATLWHEAGDAAEAEAGSHRPAFWDERNALSRRLLRDGDVPAAYAVVAAARQDQPEPASEANFLAGWIALRRLSDPATARTRFAALLARASSTTTQARARYWLARAEEALGDPAAAGDRAAAAAFPSTYYGQLAAADAAARIAAARDPVWTEAEAAAFASHELTRAAAYLVAWGEPKRAAVFLLRLPDSAGSPAELSLVAHLATGFGLPETAVALARRAGRAGVALPQSGWPVAFPVPADAGVDPALALAVMRQESSFEATVVSPAGARGLMQLMPATADSLARGLGLKIEPAALTVDPALNVRLGTAYLARMLARFGSEPAAVAAYNAGPGRLDEWGLPPADPLEAIDWVELIPFNETRNYVQRVLENAANYRVRLRPGA